MENENSVINFAGVFHGIRFKVRGLIVAMAINLFFYRYIHFLLIAIASINPLSVYYLKSLRDFGVAMAINLFLYKQTGREILYFLTFVVAL